MYMTDDAGPVLNNAPSTRIGAIRIAQRLRALARRGDSLCVIGAELGDLASGGMLWHVTNSSDVSTVAESGINDA